MLNRLKMKITIATVMLMFSVAGINVYANSRSGTDRYFDTYLPLYYGNTYLSKQTKETNLSYGKVSATNDSTCNSYDAWFCKGDTETIISNIGENLSLVTNHTINYTSNYSQGSKVRLGLEDADYTSVFRHRIIGTVNYK